MQVGKTTSYSLEKNFDEFYYEISGQRWDFVTRIIHNEEQIIRCQLRDGTDSPTAKIKYWNMDGSEAAQFTVGSGGVPYTNVLDMGWLSDDEKFCYIIMASGNSGLGSTGYSVVQALPDGASPEVLIYDINTTYTADWATASVSGYVGITASDDDIFVKIGPELFAIERSALTAPSDWATLIGGASVRSASDCFHYGDGSNCRNLMYQESSGKVLYSWYDSVIDVLYLRSISISGTVQYEPYRWAMLDISEYSDIQYPLFLNMLDSDALHVLTVDSTAIAGQTVDETPAYLEVFNIDENLAAFLNVNSSDAVMPAGIGATAEIKARVTNCWGTTLSGKLVQFWVSSGDGGVYPTYDYSDSEGRATTTFTTGANIGISNVAVVVNEV